MGFLQDIGRFFGGLFGGGEDEKKKKQQQASKPAPSQQAAPLRVVQPSGPQFGDLATPPPAPPPDKGVNLVLPDQLKKVQPKQIAADFGQKAGYGPQPAASAAHELVKLERRPIEAPQVNMPFEIARQAGLGIGHTLLDPAINNAKNLLRKTAETNADPNISPIEAIPRNVGNFVEAIGKTGVEYAGYAAPELKTLKVAEKAPALVKFGTGLLKQGATSAPLSVAADLVNGERDPITIGQHAVASTLTAGVVGGLTGLRKAEVAPGVHSVNPTQAGDAAAVQAGQAVKEAQAAIPPDALDVPAFQRNKADEAVQAAQAKLDMVNQALQKVVPRTQAVRAAEVADLQAAMARSPQEGAQVLRKQMLNKATGVQDPHEAAAQLAMVRDKAAAELEQAQAVKQAEVEAEQAKQSISVAPPVERPNAMAPHEAEQLKTLNAASKERVLQPEELSTRNKLQSKAEAIDAINNPKPVKPTAEKAQKAAPAAPPQSKSGTPQIPEFPPVSATQAPAKSVESASSVKSNTAPKKAKAPKSIPQSELPKTSVGGAAKTGETGKSKGKYARGQEYEKTSQAASRARGDQAAANSSYEQLVKKVDDNGAMSGAERDEAVSLVGRYKPGSPERVKLKSMVNKYHGEAAQVMATIERTVRRTATSDELTSRFETKLYGSSDDSLHISEDSFRSVIAKNEEFTAARDTRDQALNDFNNDPSKANAEKFAESQLKHDAADRAAKFEEYTVAKDVGKNSSHPKTKQLIDKLEKDAGVYTMDAVDSSFLSSTRVILNNFINTLSGRAEEAMFGKVGAAIARKLTGGSIGGGARAGAKLGSKLGQANWSADVRLRKGAQGYGLVKAVKNLVTSANAIGDRNTYAAAYAGVYDHYRQVLKAAGYTGEELKNRTLVNSIADPADVVEQYMHQALANNAMASLSSGTGRAKFETWLTDGLSSKFGNVPAAKWLAKAVTRVAVGFPTVVLRSAEQGFRRATGGSVSIVQAVANIATKGPADVTAKHIKNAVKEAGAGATMFGLGTALGTQGIITGPYPADKDERDAWAREGKTENSIKLGGDWYSLPATLGVFALPFMLGANAGRNITEGESATKDVGQTTVKTLLDALPTDSVAGLLDFAGNMADGNAEAAGKYAARAGASLVRGLTPAGALVNEVAKIFDPTANDTTQGDLLAQFMAKVQDGVPGLANGLPDKVVDGRVIKNPGPVARILGAGSAEQGEGAKANEEAKVEHESSADKLKTSGAMTDSIRKVLDGDSQVIFDNVKNGRKLGPKDLKKLTDAMTKGVTESGHTRFLEDGDYDSNLTVLKIKRDALAADGTTHRETLEKYDTQIRRGEVFKANKTTYEDMDAYDKTSLTEWRALADPDSDTYDQERYEKLWKLDQLLTDAKASGKSGEPDEPKYAAKKTGSGGGRRSGGGSGSSSAERAELARIRSNTIGSTPSLGKVSLGDLAPQKAGSVKIPTIQQLKAGELVKKRKITVSKA